MANTFLAFLVENLIDVLFVDISDCEVWGNAYLMGLISSIQALIVVVEYYYKESEQKYKENRQLEMKLLKMQMNPHFVFNSLSVLAGLIDIDAKRAEDYVIR
ncbi:two component system sensor histidine kinase, partial [gut metagenome]